ncbi:hypothetical protein J437_LFUL013989 [Ladona fulva]|uniref:Uncharacterized protein n=1 Tax=Ladona fulva TaxID=123851 RepID=A0A8K0KGG6_LADFU|nr:hypothetical protein J437_LFUL013989 [Ladona fulva]
MSTIMCLLVNYVFIHYPLRHFLSVIVTCYRPPYSSKNSFISELETALNSFKMHNVIILGDKNINIMNKLDMSIIKY